MARFGFAVTKRFGFRGGTQHFSNVYYYSEGGLNPSNATLELVLDELVTREKAIHSTNVTFVHGRCWSQIGTPSQNQMLVDKSLTGTGSAGPSSELDRERAFLVRFRAGVDSRGRPVYLRKWWHLDVGALASETINSTQRQNTAGLSNAQRAALVTAADGIRDITKNSIPFQLCSKNGRPISGATEAHQFVEHRQLGEEWRGI